MIKDRASKCVDEIVSAFVNLAVRMQGFDFKFTWIDVVNRTLEKLMQLRIFDDSVKKAATRRGKTWSPAAWNVTAKRAAVRRNKRE